MNSTFSNKQNNACTLLCITRKLKIRELIESSSSATKQQQLQMKGGAKRNINDNKSIKLDTEKCFRTSKWK